MSDDILDWATRPNGRPRADTVRAFRTPQPDPTRTVAVKPPVGERRRNVVLAVPLVLVSTVAVFGQWAWFAGAIEHRGADIPIPVGLAAFVCALTVETISLFLAAEAHSRLMAGDPAGPVRGMSYVVAAFIGIINWSHWQPGAVAVVFGVLSALAPWLWAIRSRSMRRADLRAAGALTPPAVKLGWARWVLYPTRTARIFRAAVWEGITDPTRALALTPPTEAGVTSDAPQEIRVVTTRPETPASTSEAPTVEPAVVEQSRGADADAVAEVCARLESGEDLSISKLAGEGRWGRTRCGEILKAARAQIAAR